MDSIIGKENLLEKLLIMGKIREEVDVFGQKITMQVLDSGDQREVFELTSTLDAIARMRAIQHETLARSIVAMNGSLVTYVAKDKDEKVDASKIIQQNLDTLKKSTQPVVDALYTEYEKLVEKQNSQIDELKKKLQKTGQEIDGESQKKQE